MGDQKTNKRYRRTQAIKQYVYDRLQHYSPQDPLIVRISKMPISDAYKLPSQKFRDPHAPFFSYPSTPIFSPQHLAVLVLLHKLGLRR